MSLSNMGYGLIVNLVCGCGFMSLMIVFGRRRDRGVAEFHIRNTTLEFTGTTSVPLRGCGPSTLPQLTAIR